MKTVSRNQDAIDRQIITNEFVRDADGNVITENVTCETARVPVLTLLDVSTMLNDQMREDQAVA